MRLPKIPTRNGAAFAAAIGLGSIAQTASAGEPANTLSGIELGQRAAGREITIQAAKKPTYSVFRLTDPYRVLVDVNDASAPEKLRYLDFASDGVVRYVSTHEFKDQASKMVRVEIGLTEDTEYDVVPEGNSIVVRLQSGKGTATPVLEPAVIPSATPEKADVAQKAEIGQLKTVVDGKRLTVSAAVSGGSLNDSAVAIQHLTSPSRMVVDIENAVALPKFQSLKVDKLGVQKARIGTNNGMVRLVLDLEEGAPLPEVSLDQASGGLTLVADFSGAKAKETVTEVKAVEPAVEEKAALAPAPAVEEKVADASAKIRNMRFEPKDGFMRLTVELDGDAPIAKDPSSTRTRPAIRIQDSKLPDALIRTLDTSAVAGQTVAAISSFNADGDTVLVANVGTATEHRHWQSGNKLYWDFRTRGGAKTNVMSYGEEGTSGFSGAFEATELGGLHTTAKKYHGRRISLDLKDADVKNILRLLADVSKLNIVAADNVGGKVTLKLRNVPWDQALDIILQSKGLDKVRVGNIIRVAPIEMLEKEEQLRLARKEALEKLETTSVRLIPVNYASANEIMTQVRSLLSQRGRVNVDARTNVLIVEDVQEVLIKAERLVRTLDTQTPQVLIEARVVEAGTSFSRSLGLQWGGTFVMAPQFGNETGLTFPNSIRIAGGADEGGNTPVDGVNANNGFAVNLPGGGGAGAGGAIGFVFASAGGSALVSLRLSAAEATGKSRIISAPKIVTLDNKAATISSGEKIPITVVTANGPTTRFISADLKLEVTPHVTAEGSISMRILASKNEVSGRTDALGVPGILTREAATEMLVRDGDTAVLGGIYRRTATESKNYVPWVGRIPVLGWLFKNTRQEDSREELLIFVSPRIVNREEALISAQ
ncbi:MAG: type IV pilus secretin PilQ [Deltaproteobacteria bacterium]|nr:type IV pilus secretin PilQ [Deltaproteobacteria bacterium]